MKHECMLTEKQIEEVKRMAENTRKAFGVFLDIPVANDIVMLIEKQGINICEYPFQVSGESHIDAAITWFETEDGPMTFIGLNSALYYDEQIFALAHELYHFQTKTGKAYKEELDAEGIITERKADRFAAELLLPRNVLVSKVEDEFSNGSIQQSSLLRVLRFIARLQCEWWLPYRSIILRLYEEGCIEEALYQKLYDVDARCANSDYAKILKSLDAEKYNLLNCRTNRKNISNRILEILIQNYEDQIIDEDEFVECLEVFGKVPEDFGFDISVAEEDPEMDLLFGDGVMVES